MPNLDLDYDPKNPSDLLGRPITEGDVVAWGTTWGQSAALCIAVIDKIKFTKEVPSGAYSTKRKECPPHEAEKYTLRLRPLKTTGDVTWVNKLTGETRWSIHDGDNPDNYVAKVKIVQHVKNVVKLDICPEDVT